MTTVTHSSSPPTGFKQDILETQGPKSLYLQYEGSLERLENVLRQKNAGIEEIRFCELPPIVLPIRALTITVDDTTTGERTGRGVITFDSESSAAEALRELDNTTVEGASLSLRYFRRANTRVDPRTHDPSALHFRFNGSLKAVKEVFHKYLEGGHVDRIEFCESALFVSF